MIVYQKWLSGANQKADFFLASSKSPTFPSLILMIDLQVRFPSPRFHSGGRLLATAGFFTIAHFKDTARSHYGRLADRK